MGRDSELKKMEEGLSLVSLAARQRPIPAWEDRSRKSIILCVTIAGLVLLICAVIYSRLCPCFTSWHVKHLSFKDGPHATFADDSQD